MAYAMQLYCFLDRTDGISFVYLSNALLLYYGIAEVIIVMFKDGKSQYRMDFKRH
jgi:hypothetical protein